MLPLLVVTDIPEIDPVEAVPVLVPIVVLLIVPLPGLVSSGAVKLPAFVPMLTSVVVPCPAAEMLPLLVVTDMPENEPVETVPVLVPMVVLLIVPLPAALGSSGAVNEPPLVPMLTSVVVPCPAAVMLPLLVVTDMPEIEPVETVPVLVPIVVLLIVPLPGVESSGAVKVPPLVPML